MLRFQVTKHLYFFMRIDYERFVFCKYKSLLMSSALWFILDILLCLFPIAASIDNEYYTPKTWNDNMVIYDDIVLIIIFLRLGAAWK